MLSTFSGTWFFSTVTPPPFWATIVLKKYYYGWHNKAGLIRVCLLIYMDVVRMILYISLFKFVESFCKEFQIGILKASWGQEAKYHHIWPAIPIDLGESFSGGHQNILRFPWPVRQWFSMLICKARNLVVQVPDQFSQEGFLNI